MPGHYYPLPLRCRCLSPMRYCFDCTKRTFYCCSSQCEHTSGTQISRNSAHKWAKLDNCTYVFFWFVFVFLEVNSQHPWHHTTPRFVMSLFAISSVSTKDFFILSENSVCKASVFFGTNNSVCILVFLKTFRKTYRLKK